jgi:hypothetical protein
MVQGAAVGPTDIHPGAFAHGFQPLKHFDRGGIVFFLGVLARKKVVCGHAAALVGFVSAYTNAGGEGGAMGE